MSKLFWFIFSISFLSMFENSLGVSGYNDLSVSGLKVLQRRFVNEKNRSDPMWTDLRDDNKVKLRNLCVLTWNMPPEPGYVRQCSYMPHLLDGNGTVTFFAMNGKERHLLIRDGAACFCSYGTLNEWNQKLPPYFFITPTLDSTEYFKWIADKVGDNYFMVISDLMSGVPEFNSIPDQEFYYDLN